MVLLPWIYMYVNCHTHNTIVQSDEALARILQQNEYRQLQGEENWDGGERAADYLPSLQGRWTHLIGHQSQAPATVDDADKVT